MVEVISSPTQTSKHDSNRKSKRVRGIYNFVARNYLNLFSTVLLVAALFYFVQIQQLRFTTLSNNPELFQDNEIVTVTRVIDGDEIRVRNSSGSTLVRILGIKSFDSTERDLVLAEYGKVAVDFLEAEAVGKKAQIKLSDKKVDNEGRLLARVFIGENQERDVAQSMVASGLTLVFTKFPFPAMDDYLKSQDEARTKSMGFWRNERVKARAESMLDLWNQERRDN